MIHASRTEKYKEEAVEGLEGEKSLESLEMVETERLLSGERVSNT